MSRIRKTSGFLGLATMLTVGLYRNTLLMAWQAWTTDAGGGLSGRAAPADD